MHMFLERELEAARYLCQLLLILMLGVICSFFEMREAFASHVEPSPQIVIEKSKFLLSFYEGRTAVFSFPIAVGLYSGNKKKGGDMRTPTGHFVVESIHDSRHWVHDFKDGKGPIKGAYGPWFIRLKTGWSGIGIHGTHAPDSIGKKTTEGCVRLLNEHIELLVKRIQSGVLVTIKE